MTAIYLVGLMGSGKSTVGRRLANALAARFVDADEALVATAGKPIARVFAEDGEAAFRALEERTVAAIVDSARAAGVDVVVALGGGAVLSAATRRRLGQTGFTLWLRAPPDELARRTMTEFGAGAEERPLLSGLGREGRIARFDELLRARGPLYEAVADLVVDTGGREAGAVVGQVLEWLEAVPPVRVEAGGGGYDVFVERGGLGRLGRRLRRAGLAPGPVGLVVERAVEEIGLLERAVAGLEAGGYRPSVLRVPSGEEGKTLAQVGALCEGFAAARLERGTPVVGLGGGALGDAAGFAAAVYLRGVPLVLAPTTLLAQVDAAIGGKTAANLPAGKNLVGAFHAPRVVVADPDVLATLPAREARSGLGEVLKYALIAPPADGLLGVVDDALADALAPWAERGEAAAPDARLLADLVRRCARIKADVVSRDEREAGPRKVLNLGHTIGHAIEAAAGYGPVAHGDAVVHGLYGALWLSEREGLLAASARAGLEALLDRLPVPPVPASVADEAVLAAIVHDKKVRDGKLLFVLLRGPGDPVLDVEVSLDEAAAALACVRARGREPERERGRARA